MKTNFENIHANATINELYEPAINKAMENSPDANDYFDALVESALSTKDISRQDAVELIKSNIGYFAGYYGKEERIKVWEVYGSIHPVFGNTFPTAKEAFEIGMRIAKNSKYGNNSSAESR